MSPVKTGFITSLQSILPAPWGRSCIYHTSVECTAGAQYREVSAREARVSNMNNGDEGIIVQGHGFMLDLTWQQSRSNEFLLSSALTFDYLPFHGLQVSPVPQCPCLLSFSHVPLQCFSWVNFLWRCDPAWSWALTMHWRAATGLI